MPDVRQSPGTIRMGSVRGVPVYVAWPVLLYVGFFTGVGLSQVGRIGLFAPLGYLLVIAVHEAGHAACVRRRGHHVLAVEVHPHHGVCAWRGYDVSPLDRALVAWGGVLAQAGLAAVTLPFALLPFASRELFSVLVAGNLLVAGYNLLPLPGLDGAEAWRILRLLEEEGELKAWVRRHRPRRR